MTRRVACLLIDHTRQVCPKECFNQKVPLADTPQGIFSFACSFQIPVHLVGDFPRAPFHSPAHSTCSFPAAPPQRSVPRMLLSLCRCAGRICSPQGVGAIPHTATHQGPTYKSSVGPHASGPRRPRSILTPPCLPHSKRSVFLRPFSSARPVT